MYLSEVQVALGDSKSAEAGLREALELLPSLGRIGDGIAEPGVFNYLGVAQYASGDYVAARDNQARAVMPYHRLGNRLGEARAMCDLGTAQHAAGDRAGAVATLTDMLKMFRHLGYRYLEAKALHHLGIMGH